MNKVLILFIVMLVSNSLFAQNTNAKDSASKTGKVYFLRSTGLSFITKRFSLFIDDELVCKIDEKRYSLHQLKPGKHFFSVQTGGTKPKQKGQQIDIKIEPGKSYYIQIIMQMDIWVSNIICQEVTENSANKILSSLREEKDCL